MKLKTWITINILAVMKFIGGPINKQSWLDIWMAITGEVLVSPRMYMESVKVQIHTQIKRESKISSKDNFKLRVRLDFL